MCGVDLKHAQLAALLATPAQQRCFSEEVFVPAHKAVEPGLMWVKFSDQI